MLGSGDVDYMDPNVSYYTVGYEALRMISRSLLNYPAVAGTDDQRRARPGDLDADGE